MGAADKKRARPAKTLEGRENQLIAEAVEMAAEQLANRTASAQVLTHYLRLGTVKAQLELEQIKQQNELLKAKTESLESAKRIEKLYEEAISAWRGYSGQPEQDEESYED